MWEFAAADDLFDHPARHRAGGGGAEAGNLLETLIRIRDEVRDAVAAYVDGDVYRVPLPAVLVTGTEPPSDAVGVRDADPSP